MRFRHAVPDDAGPVAELVNAAFTVEEFFIHGGRTTEAEVQGTLHRGGYIVADDGGVLIGCVYVEVRGPRGYFGLLAVRPGRQRGGLGRRLVALAEQHCRDAGCAFMDLQIVNLRGDLPAYYQALGYAETETLPWPPEFAAKLKQPACFVRMSKSL